MNVHKNAKLTPTGRAQMIERLEAGASVTEVAASIGISPTTVYKWRKRWEARGKKGLRTGDGAPVSLSQSSSVQFGFLSNVSRSTFFVDHPNRPRRFLRTY